jgi:hypothetical protein
VQDNQFYELGIVSVPLKNNFTICEEKILQLEQVPEVKISWWEYTIKSSLWSGVWYKLKDKFTSIRVNVSTSKKLIAKIIIIINNNKLKMP